MAQTRTFTREALAEIGVPFDLVTEAHAHRAPHAAVQLHDKQTEARRWVSVHDLVFRAPDDGRCWQVTYQQGLTEMQEDTDPWNYETTVTATEVVARQTTTTEWVPAGTPGTTIPADVAAHVLHAFGREGGYPAGSFTQKLIALIDQADDNNIQLLRLGFPEYVAAILTIQNNPAGVQHLQARALSA